ncbi:MAG: PIG-L deacetylase family protein [Ghiorsea sp.]|nr:PIG-L deacetylase family protein [Ghiorsea sp.]
MSTILALAPHPDDLEIGCGGTLAVHAQRGDDVFIYVATSGECGGIAQIRRQEQEAAAKILGVKKVFWGMFEDTKLPEVSLDLMCSLEAVMQETNPDTVYINHIHDTHQDHREIAQVAHSATRYVPNVLAYETPSTTHFEPTVYMDTSDTLTLKISALEAHDSQVERTRVRLNIIEIAMATSHFRGVQGKMSCAEAFMPIRIRL